MAASPRRVFSVSSQEEDDDENVDKENVPSVPAKRARTSATQGGEGNLDYIHPPVPSTSSSPPHSQMTVCFNASFVLKHVATLATTRL